MLQRVVVRMLFDPLMVDAVYVDAHMALPEMGLSDHEIAWLTAPDPRRWAADPYRRARSLEVLLEEYPVSGAIVMRAESGPELLSFFSSRRFHDGIQAGYSMALVFGGWLSERTDCVATLARIELAIANSRRAASPDEPPELPPTDTWQRRPGVFPLSLVGGSLNWYQDCLLRLRDHPMGVGHGIIDGEWAMPNAQISESLEGAIVEGGANPSVGHAPLPLIELLENLGAPKSINALGSVLENLNLAPEEAKEILEDLVNDGLLLQH